MYTKNEQINIFSSSQEPLLLQNYAPFRSLNYNHMESFIICHVLWELHIFEDRLFT